MTRNEATYCLNSYLNDGKGCKNCTYPQKRTDCVNDALNMAIKALSADVPQWIPCSERLPKEDGDYLVTLDFAWGKELEMGEWFCGEWINPNRHVTVAWMPLPEPGKGEEDDKRRSDCIWQRAT